MDSMKEDTDTYEPSDIHTAQRHYTNSNNDNNISNSNSNEDLVIDYSYEPALQRDAFQLAEYFGYMVYIY